MEKPEVTLDQLKAWYSGLIDGQVISVRQEIEAFIGDWESYNQQRILPDKR